jgi:hypothetical protein
MPQLFLRDADRARRRAACAPPRGGGEPRTTASRPGSRTERTATSRRPALLACAAGLATGGAALALPGRR